MSKQIGHQYRWILTLHTVFQHFADHQAFASKLRGDPQVIGGGGDGDSVVSMFYSFATQFVPIGYA